MKSLLAIFALSIATIAFAMTARQQEAVAPAMSISDVARSWDANTEFVVPEREDHTADEKKKWALLRDVMACESGSRWVVVTVPGKGQDAGPCQINTFYHAVPAARSGFDILNPSENMLYCVQLFEQYYPDMQAGKWSPWENTKDCWRDKQNARREESGDSAVL